MPNALPHKIAKLWVILKPLATAARASNAPLAIGGLAYRPKNLSVRKKVLLWLVMKPDKSAVEILVAGYIKNVPALHPIFGTMELVLAILLTNTPAPAPATPAAPTPLAAENTPPVPAPAVMSGKMAVAKNKFSTVPKVICIIATARWSALRLAIWASMSR